MALDIKIDFVNGKLVNDYVNGRDKILQQVKIATRILKGHWKYDSDYGIGLIEDGNNSSIILQDTREMIAQVENVIAIKSLNVTENFDTHGNGTFAISGSIQLSNETIKLEDEGV